jgi:hypothetical protein
MNKKCFLIETLSNIVFKKQNPSATSGLNKIKG